VLASCSLAACPLSGNSRLPLPSTTGWILDDTVERYERRYIQLAPPDRAVLRGSSWRAVATQSRGAQRGASEAVAEVVALGRGPTWPAVACCKQRRVAPWAGATLLSGSREQQWFPLRVVGRNIGEGFRTAMVRSIVIGINASEGRPGSARGAPTAQPPGASKVRSGSSARIIERRQEGPPGVAR
jgi:hypothetical protein